MAQIVPLDAITPQPHVSIGKKLMDLSDAADARKLAQQTLASNKLKIDAATKEAQQNTAYDQSIALGGTDADQIKRAQAIGAGPYADALKRQKDNEQADALRQKTEHEAFGQFVDSTRKLLEPIYAPDTAESDRPLIYHHILNTIKSTGSKYAELLPADFDPTMLKQFEDAKLQNDMAIKASDEKIKLAKEERDKLESVQKLENDKLTGKKTQSEIDNAGMTPDLKEFNDTHYFDTYLKNHKIEKSSLNPDTEAAHRGQAFVEFKQAQNKDSNPTVASLASAAAKGDKDAQKALDIIQSQSDEGTSITPDSLDMIATQFAKTGALPALGMGKSSAGDRRKIFNRASELYPKVDIASNKADYDANKQSERTLTTNRDQIVSFENTAGKNLDNFLSTAKNIYDSDSPWINAPIRTINERGLGSADLAAFNAARQVAINEIAKVTSNPGLTGQLSDAARKEVESFIPSDATLKQIYSVAAILKSDMKNRHDSLDEQLKEIQKRIAAPPKSQAKSGPQKGDKQTYNGSTYTFDGTQYVKDKK